MPNIVSFSDIDERKEDQESVFSFTGGLKSGIQVESNSSGEKPRTVELYKDGFTVDGGEFRSLEDPENKKFISEIQQGIAPKELHCGSSEICIQLVDRRSIPFPGNQNKPKHSPRGPRFEKYDKIPGNIRKINVKLYTGETIYLEISESASISDLFESISGISQLDIQQFILLSDYPPKQISYPLTALLSSTGTRN